MDSLYRDLLSRQVERLEIPEENQQNLNLYTGLNKMDRALDAQCTPWVEQSNALEI